MKLEELIRLGLYYIDFETPDAPITMNLLIDIREFLLHKDSKWSVCQISPIEGIRYLCMNCDLFELCSECEQKYGEKHGHPLLKLRKEDYLKIYNNEIFNNNNKQMEIKEEN